MVTIIVGNATDVLGAMPVGVDYVAEPGERMFLFDLDMGGGVSRKAVASLNARDLNKRW